MNNIKSKNKKTMFAGLVIFFVVILVIIYFLFFKTKTVIYFNEKYLSLEYGETLDYKKTIESVNPKDAKITYPDIEVKEVGRYKLTFAYSINGKNGIQEQEFVVKDTKLPSVILKNKKTVEVLENSQYDLFANIDEYKNLSEEALANKQQVNDKEYTKIKKQIKKQNEKVLNREITKKEDIKSSDIMNNGILFTTDFDITKKETYKIKMLFIDENYNSYEQEWKIKVVEAGQIVNSGGTVSCVYPNENLQMNEAYTTDYREVYTYDTNKLVSSLNFITKMTFKDDYDTDANINDLVNEINSKYNKYNDYKGVSVNVEPTSTEVTTNIIIDFNEYDLKNDPLKILEVKDSGKVKIENVVDKLKDKATCELH